MAEPRRVAFISLSPVRRREAEYAGAEREPEYPREPPRLEPQPPPHREPLRAEQPVPREAAPRSDAQPPPREKPLPPREGSRPEPPMALQREPPRPEPPPPPLPQLPLQPPPPREAASRPEPPPRPPRETVRLELVLKDPTDESCVEFSYPELLLCGEQRVQKLPPSSPGPRRPRHPSACPSGLHFLTPTLRGSGRPGGRAGGPVVGARFPLLPGVSRGSPPHPPPPAPPTPFVSRKPLRAGFPPFFLLPTQIRRALRVVWVGFPCGAPAVLSGRKEARALGDTPLLPVGPGNRAPSRVSAVSIPAWGARRCGR